MGSKYDFDYLVIGSGAAGRTAALMAGRSGKKVAIAEAKQWGGATLVGRDVPYAAASHFSQLYNASVRGARMGISSANLKFNYPTSLHWQLSAIKSAGGGSKKELEEAGVKCLKGFAHFLEPNKLAIGNNGTVTAKKILIATGAVPITQGITGAETVECLTPEEATRMRKLPKVVMVVGGGASGCEVAEYLAELGVKVLLAELSERIMPKEDMEVAEVLTRQLSKRLGVKVLTGARVVAVQKEKSIVKVVFMSGGRERSVRVEQVVLATGSQPATDLGLENAGVKYGAKGIKVNAAMQTSARHIYAAGDVVATKNEVSSTEKAAYESAVAMANMLNHAKGTVDYRGFVRMTGTFPRVASVGLTEDQCMQRDLKYRQATVLAKETIASAVEGFEDGFMKLIVNREGRILGATVVCPRADLVIQEIVLAMRTELKLLDLATAPHVATGWNELVKLAARRLANGRKK